MNGLMWWIDRWRKSTAFTDMTLAEQGAYRNLLDEATLRGGAVPNDERVLARACGDARSWSKVRTAVLARFELRADGWHNETLDEVLAKAKGLQADRSIAGKLGAEKRWGTGSNGKPDSKPYGNSYSKANGKLVTNAVTNGIANECHQDPDPERERSKEQERSPRARARKLAYDGTNLKVTHGQHDWLLGELGSAAPHLDVLALYERWDAARPVDATDTLEYLKVCAKQAVRSLRAGGPLYGSNEGTGAADSIWRAITAKVFLRLGDHRERMYFRGSEVVEDTEDRVIVRSDCVKRLTAEPYRSLIADALGELRPGCELVILPAAGELVGDPS